MISQMLETMWINVLGNSILAALGLILIFAYLCFKKNLGLVETLIVSLPVVLSVSTTGCFGNTGACVPIYIEGFFIIGVGVLWALAFKKLIQINDPATIIFLFYICINSAFLLNGYIMPLQQYDSSGFLTNYATNSSTAISSQTDTTYGLIVSTIEQLPRAVLPLINFMFGGAIWGFISTIGLPQVIVTIISIPILLVAPLCLLPIILQLSSILANLATWKNILIAGGIAAVGVIASYL